MSDSLYILEDGTPVPLNLGTGAGPEYAERIEALEDGQDELRALIAQEVAKCLKLTGGTLLGNINFSQDGDTALWKTKSTARFILRGGGSEFTDGASLYLHGKSRTTDPGVALFYAHDGTQNAWFKLTPAGEAFVKSDKVLTAAGGSVGPLLCTANDAVKRSVDNANLVLRGGTGAKAGQLTLFGGTLDSASAGEARLTAYSSTGATYIFRVAPDGNLYHKGVRARFVVEHWNDGGEDWYRKYNDGWIEQGGRVGISSRGDATISFHTPFSNNSYFTLLSGVGYSTADRKTCSSIGVATRRTNGMDIYQVNTDGDDYFTQASWYVCGM